MKCRDKIKEEGTHTHKTNKKITIPGMRERGMQEREPERGGGERQRGEGECVCVM